MTSWTRDVGNVESESLFSDTSRHNSADVSARYEDRYQGTVRAVAAVLSGVLAGVLLLNSMQVGVAFAFGEDASRWEVLQWGNHWMWRAVASLLATWSASFLAGMIARRRGQFIGVVAALPSCLYWLLVSVAGLFGRIPGTSLAADVPVGYSAVAALLVLATLPCGANGGREGAAYGRANAEHFDSRRAALLGIRWYHFAWLPLLIHAMLMTGMFGAVIAFQWFTAVWRSGMSILAIVPVLFFMSMMATLHLLGKAATGTYEALAGFDDRGGRTTFGRVMKFGVGYFAATVVLQAAINLAHFGLSAALKSIFG